MDAWPGTAYPLGATFDGSGTNFALFSEVAEKVELCLFDEEGAETRVELVDVDAFVWHVYLPAVQAGQRYGYRVYGPWDPEHGHRCNPTKLLLDPYAKATSGQIIWGQEMFSYDFADPTRRNDEDSAANMMYGVVVNPYFDWSGESRPRTAYVDSFIYETHVRGLTMNHPALPDNLRGTYSGLAHPAIIDHLTSLGVTAVELMPVHEFLNDSVLQEKGLSNYWGYNTIGFFAPHSAYAASGDRGQQVQEFQSMVKALHNAGIEVILDVVYNHTAEGNHQGPTVSMRGIDNAAYYRLVDGNQQYYLDYTGTGNSMNMRNPHTLQIIMDSLRYWVTEMHVDGFRFDLAATLAREFYEVDRLSSFFELVQQDPIVSQVKLIAEPWDVGPGGYQVGNFPPLWTEWNGQYRDTVRDFWRGEPSSLGEFASRLTGSSDLYEHTGRRPFASINFVTAHDGFTLRDLVSYNDKHNDANGEDGRDGESHNRSWNCGVEGDTDDETVLQTRSRQQRNFIATLLLSQGVPMMLHGDELGRTQGGNNNVYAQDSVISWVDWENADTLLIEFTRQLSHLRKRHPTFRRSSFFDGRPVQWGEGEPLPDIVWFAPDAHPMTEEDWTSGVGKTIGVYLNGASINRRDSRGRRMTDIDFLILFSADSEPVPVTVPGPEFAEQWTIIVDTGSNGAGHTVQAGASHVVNAHSMVVLAQVVAEEPPANGVRDTSVSVDALAAAATSMIATQQFPDYEEVEGEYADVEDEARAKANATGDAPADTGAEDSSASVRPSGTSVKSRTSETPAPADSPTAAPTSGVPPISADTSATSGSGDPAPAESPSTQPPQATEPE